CYAHRRVPPSFPTRRSSDLGKQSESAMPRNGHCLRFTVVEFCSKLNIGFKLCLGFRLHRVQKPFRNECAQIDRHLRLASIRCERSEEHTSELQSRENLVCRL